MDPYAHLKGRAWREAADLDARLAAGEIGRSTRPNRKQPGMDYRVLWVDA